tara:strand:- start:5947 stop:6348 length:402 start_codon:yes stop_codon:yes gene_type:complete
LGFNSKKNQIMKNKNRPLSPHLQIYKPQITSILSISHRFTGVILYLSTFLVSLWLFCTAFNSNLKIILNNFLFSHLGQVVLFFISLSFTYHLLNGLRHIIWDFGYGFNIKNVYLTGFVIIFLTLTINIYIWFF